MQWLVNLLVSVAQLVWDHVSVWLWDVVCYVSLWFWDRVWQNIQIAWAWLSDLASNMIQCLLLQLPPGLAPDFETLRFWWEVANYWVPLAESSVVLGTMCSFWAIFCVFKYGWRLIPVFH